MQWIWDKRMTKAGTEVVSIHEGLQETLGKFREAIEGKIKDDCVLEDTREFTRHLEVIDRTVEATGVEVKLKNFPRLCNQVDYEPRQRGIS